MANFMQHFNLILIRTCFNAIDFYIHLVAHFSDVAVLFYSGNDCCFRCCYWSVSFLLYVYFIPLESVKILPV